VAIEVRLMAQVRLEKLERDYGSVRAVDGVSLTVEDGELFALLGSSGSGKTTTLRCVAGLEQPDGGAIYIGNELMTDRAPFDRPCGMVFQSYALFPHLTVFDNIAYGLRARDYRMGGALRRLSVLAGFTSRRVFPPTDAMRTKVRDALHIVDLEGQGDKLPGQLSGGMQQRVALARALITEPKVLLLDEPLSNLDRKLRINMRGMVRKLQQTLRITAIYVTHDQEEALSMADRIAIMNKGRIVQLGTPAEIYDKPATAFVADFIGAENLLPGRIESRNGGVVEVDAGGLKIRSKASASQDRVRVVVRPQAIQLARRTEPLQADNLFDGVVQFSAYLGATARYEVAVKDHVFIVDVPDPRPGALLSQGESVKLGFASSSVILVSEA
jgi:iron(III) transport system ATP-binding protein